MNIRELHPWDVSFQEAVEIQKALRHQLIFKNLPENIRLVAGTDVSCLKNTNTMKS